MRSLERAVLTPVADAFRALRYDAAQFPGEVLNNDALFAEAFSNINTKSFSTKISYNLYEDALAKLNKDIAGTTKLYSFPPFKPGAYNCATYPESIGLPLPPGAASGKLIDLKLPRQ